MSLGQYFTINELLQNTVCGLIKNIRNGEPDTLDKVADKATPTPDKPTTQLDKASTLDKAAILDKPTAPLDKATAPLDKATAPLDKATAADPILEPSVGRGHLLIKILEKYNVPVIAYEIDTKLKILPNISDRVHPIYRDFLKAKINHTFDTIVGNPPYVKSPTGNLYLDFIRKCYGLLNPNGEMIMIVPSDILKSTQGTLVRNVLLQNGSFTDIIQPHDEKLFTDASIDVIVFRYQKGLHSNKVMYNKAECFLQNNGIIIITETIQQNTTLLSDIFDISVGMVTGLEEVFKVPFGNISVRNSETAKDKYILIDEFPSGNEEIDTHMLEHKDKLLSRRIRKFTETNWYEWGALRNVKAIKNNLNRPCIYIKTLTRSTVVAFKGKVEYFGGSLIMLVQKPLDYDINLDEFVDYFNSSTFTKKYIQSGRFKIGHRQLSLAGISLE